MTKEGFLKKHRNEQLQINAFYKGFVIYSDSEIKIKGTPKNEYLYKFEFVVSLFDKLDNIEIDYLPF